MTVGVQNLPGVGMFLRELGRIQNVVEQRADVRMPGGIGTQDISGLLSG